jgi:hypothetical protein
MNVGGAEAVVAVQSAQDKCLAVQGPYTANDWFAEAFRSLHQLARLKVSSASTAKGSKAIESHLCIP